MLPDGPVTPAEDILDRANGIILSACMEICFLLSCLSWKIPFFM